MNAAKKGSRLERKAELELQAKGFRTWKKIRVRYQNNDIFKLFDLLALHPEGEHMLLIQVKANKVDNRTRDEIRSLKVPSGIRKEIWIWRDNRGWIKEFYE